MTSTLMISIVIETLGYLSRIHTKYCEINTQTIFDSSRRVLINENHGRKRKRRTCGGNTRHIAVPCTHVCYRDREGFSLKETRSADWFASSVYLCVRLLSLSESYNLFGFAANVRVNNRELRNSSNPFNCFRSDDQMK